MNYIPGSRSWVSIGFLLIALICLVPADISIYPSDPWLEFRRLLAGLISPEIGNAGEIGRQLVNTITFALLGVALSSVCGFFWHCIFIGVLFVWVVPLYGPYMSYFRR